MTPIWPQPDLMVILAIEVVIAAVCIHRTAKNAHKWTSLKVSQSFRKMVYGRLGDIGRYECVIDYGLNHGREGEALKRLQHWMGLERIYLLEAVNVSPEGT
ncbi:MAG: hypothetical protein ACJ8C4_07015 [Gemmataceae bacterium]